MSTAEESKVNGPVHVVAVNTKEYGKSTHIEGYTEQECSDSVWRKNILENKKIVSLKCPVADLCGLPGFTIYCTTSKCHAGLDQTWRKGGKVAAMRHFQIISNTLMSENNGAATYLTSQLDTGLCEAVITGKVYIVCDEGRYPLSKFQVWGIQEMINCAMDIYDMDPANMVEGEETVRQWAKDYRTQTWEPMSGSAGRPIYAPKSV